MKTLILSYSIRYEGDTTPELEGTQRVRQREDETLEQCADRIVHELCRQLHQPKQQWRIA